MSEAETKQPGIDTKPAAPAKVDQAWDYLASHADNQNTDHVDLAATRRKIDLRIMPFMFCCYFLQFIDKVMYNVSFLVLGTKEAFWLRLYPIVCCRHGHEKGSRTQRK